MQLQQAISLQVNQSQVGKQLDVLIEGRDRNVSIGRSYRDAPEIDGLVFVEGQAPVGRFTRVRVTGAMPYDLTAMPLTVSESRVTASSSLRVGPPSGSPS